MFNGDITVTLRAEDPFSGIRRWRIAPKDVQVLLSWEGFDIDAVRGCQGVRADGSLWFTTGVGYAVFDADLLGGDGSGRAEERFNRDGFGIIVR